MDTSSVSEARESRDLKHNSQLPMQERRCFEDSENVRRNNMCFRESTKKVCRKTSITLACSKGDIDCLLRLLKRERVQAREDENFLVG